MSDTSNTDVPLSKEEEDQQTKQREVNERLLALAAAGDADGIEALLRERPEIYYQEPTTGTSALMAAAANGHVEAMQVILENGAPWNALDRSNCSAGDYAFENGHQEAVDFLLQAGVRAELLLSMIRKRKRAREAASSGIEAPAKNADYLESDIEYTNDSLIDAFGRGVMMQWEEGLMKHHANVLCRTKGDVLNVGFGMGIIDGFVEELEYKTHTIIEAHPAVYAKMKHDGWLEKPNVRVLFGRWQDVIPQLGTYDSIFFDTFGEDDEEMQQFHELLPTILKEGGTYSFFNGMAPSNFFFHGVACETVRLQLEELGIFMEYIPVKVDVDEEVWKEVSIKYWSWDVYYLPLGYRPTEEELLAGRCLPEDRQSSVQTPLLVREK
eukprot:CAMPEP_0174246984 /NCGR_PEP_ID=MMETSP0417-20130205/42342_1 /TAXON_ID=242541 /ORGANISM="Mayorella sp, Strain BSH-02190019" /LENGTH=381 /DNA_ID=CAMNT_0015326837 /DNA_START=508 /DNA_END=1653 /DNA_ORIENTATION=-